MQTLLKKLRASNIKLNLSGDKLDINAPKGVLTNELLDEIRVHKQKIIDFIKLSQNAGDTHSDIPNVEQEETYIVSSSQKSLWLLCQLEEQNNVYNIPSIFELKGNLDTVALEKAFEALLERHESLRTVFVETANAEVRQKIVAVKDLDFKFRTEDVSNTDEKIDSLIQQELKFSFDLAKDCLVRAKLIKTSNDTFVFVLVLHHIISDGWSIQLMINELFVLYHAFTKNISNPLAPLQIQYKDYAAWQQNQLRDGNTTHKEYWLKQFQDTIPILDLPIYKTRPLTKTFSGGIVKRSFNSEILKAFSNLCQSQDATLFMGLTSLLNVLFYRYTNQNDIIIGTPIAGRPHSDLQNQTGLYLNTLALRTQFDGQDSFIELLSNVKNKTLEAYEHQLYPFDELIENLNLKREVSRSPLFDVMLILQNMDSFDSTQQLDGVTIQQYQNKQNLLIKYDLEFTFDEFGNELNFNLTFNTDIYTEAFVEKITEHFGTLLQGVIAAPNLPVSRINYLSPNEIKQLVVDFNDTSVPYPKDKTIVQLFEEQAAETPDAIAIVFEDLQLTYKELNEKVNQFASYLRERYDIQPDDLVGIKLSRSEQLIIAILGVLKSGAAYVPIDSDYPQERIAYIEEDTNCKAIIDEDELIMFNFQRFRYKPENPDTVNTPSHLAYIIYTSGSTGNPKGVMVEHRNVVRLVKPCTYFPLHSDTVLLSTGSISFDATTIEFFGTLLNGGTLVLTTQDDLLDLSTLGNIVKTNAVNSLWMTASWFNSVVENNISFFESIRQLIVGGDVVSPKHTQKVFESNPSIKIVNGYGPTENTTFSVTFDIQNEKYTTIPIGKPIPNSQAYVLDQNLQPVAIGVGGKLYLSGDGVSRGYLNQPELTSEKFIANPFISDARMYDTGDLGRWLPDGTIEFLGRNDHQVKIRGYRIELGEIETSLLQFSADLKQVVVQVKEVKEEKVLVAYYVSDIEIDKIEIRNYLQTKLPEYMIPAFFVLLEAIPLTSNGKTDRNALPGINGEDSIRREYVQPRNETEQKMVEIWQEVLGLEKVGITDNFFEMGGHSLIVAQVINRLNKQLNKTVSFKDFFSNPTIEALSKTLNQNEYEAIPPAGIRESYPLTASQNRFWILSQLEGGSLAYNMPSAIKLTGDLDTDTFKETFSLLIERYEILRTGFKNNSQGEIQQYITPVNEINFEVTEQDFSNHKEQEDLVLQYLEEQNSIAFNLEEAPLIRASLIKLQENEHIFSLCMHHIIGDGWSMQLIISEIVKTYNAIVQGNSANLPDLNIQYKDYAVWINAENQQEKYQQSKEFWLNQFSGELPVIELPGFKKRPLVQTYNGAVKSYAFSAALLEKLKTFSGEHDVTLFMTLITGIKTLLHRYSNQDDLIIGTPIAGREHPDLENQLGLFLNTLAIRTKFEQGDRFLDILNKEKETLLNAYQHQDYSFDELVGNLNLKRDLSRSALFDILVVLQNQAQLKNLANDTALTGLEVDAFDFENKTSKFDITFIFVETEQLLLNINYNTDIYDSFLIDALFSHLENVFSEGINNPEQAVDQLDYLTAAEKTTLLLDFNATAAAYPENKTIIDLFEEQLEKTPDNIAVVFEETALTYQVLNEQANQLAHYLRQNHAIESGDLVGIKLDRSERIIVTILGILKSGAAYVPIDSSYPQERIAYIEKDSNCKIVIDEPVFEAFYKNRESYSGLNIEKINNSGDLAYIIYTSGTTGNPKGVMVEHKNVINLIHSQTREFKIDATERILQLSNFSFDASVEQTFLALLNGAALYILPRKVLLDEVELEQFVLENKITHFHSVPSVVSKLKPSNKFSLRRVLSGGDICSEKLAASWSTICDFYNKYGPTETTVTSIEFLYTKEKPFSIGRPISNTQVYILNNALLPTPLGVLGNVYISGAGVTRGYWNKPELTAEKFIENPFISGTKMYDTGDVARWLPDGNIEFSGRNDHQVKIRGFRIELGEIETSLLQYSAHLNEAIVQAKEVNGEKVLVAYYLTNAAIDKAAIRNYLLGKLPEHMVPSFYIDLDHFPVTPNGKIDRKALPGISGEDGIRKEYIQPRNETEQKIAEIWQEVLAVEKVGITDNFFELGGHSLIVAQVINRLNKQLNKTVSFKDFFSNPTIEALSKTLNQNDYISIPQADIRESYPLTASQYRFWILSQLEGGSLAYNMPAAIKLTGELDTDTFKKTFHVLIQRHEILRTGFKNNAEGQLRQFIKPAAEIVFEVTEKDFSHKEGKEALVLQYLQEQNAIAFNLEQAPLIRASLLKTDENEHVFFISLHHIIGDGWSMQLIISEVVKIYNAILQGIPVDLPPLNLQYKDYAVWINEAIQQEKYQNSKAFWLNQFEGPLPVLELPSFKKRPLVQTYNGDNQSHQFSGVLLEKLKTFSKEQDVTLFMTLMAGIKTLLHRYTNQEDIIVGTPIAGREHPDLENQLGLYLNTLAIRTKFEEEDDFLAILNKEKETLLNAYQHQEYSFDELVENLNLKRDLSRSALFDVLVVLQNQNQLKNLANPATLAGIEVAGFEFENKIAKLDVTFTFVETEQLILNIDYNTDIYDSVFIKSIFGHLENVFNEVIDNPEQAIEELDYLTIAEEKKLLLEYNNNSTAYPKDKTMIDLFEDQVAKTPENSAVVFEDKSFTYKEINEQANQLGSYLRENYQIKTDDLIGIKLDRSEKMIVTLLGILKSGAAYVPIDKSYPQERIEYIEKDSNCKLVIDENVLELFYNSQEKYAKVNVQRTNTPDDLAYIIYTSGTTGNPKGVMIEHKNAVALIHWSDTEFDSSKFETVYAVTSYCFDLSVFEIFYTLSIGKQIKLLKNGLEIKNHIDKDQNVLINTVPSVVNQLLEDGVSFESVSILNMAGEPISHSIIQRLPLDQIEVYNLYGPSEDTTYSTYFKIRQKDYLSIPIGKPISNTQLYILDKKWQAVPTGVFGKIYVAGAGVARGYLNKPELTAEKFMDNPFKSGSTMYDTGDLGRWLPDGNIEFLGRNDHQVKIRGFRIELGEIEARFSQYSADIKQVVVEVKEVNAEKVLVAYYAAQTEIDKAAIRNYLLGKLPEYMVPSFYVVLDSLPLTPNGKTDRKALPGISGEDLIRKVYVAPANETEKKMAAIWQEILGLEEVGITDNFFELGGNSISAINTIIRMNKEFATHYPVDSLFRFNTISEIIKYHLNTIFDSDKDFYEYGNSQSSNTVFAFPPIAGYGSAYRDLFHNNQDSGFISFNFVEKEANPVAYYANKINEIQENGEIVLFGWSAGGILSSEVAHHLTNVLNRKVSRIIMFDSVRLDEEKLNIELSADAFDPGTEIDESMQEILAQAKEKRIAYIKYLMSVKYANKLSTELVLVKTENNEDKKWEENFETVHYITGKGAHQNMLEGNNLKHNKKILHKIITKEDILTSIFQD
ncbi:amino acid adenylation domain-containing protein [Flavobacterium circumlabens]|uniref:Amino acid adenylation domain-containing protein n=1 Tax=Flavobacterium circumlabens TaxID=2133765 RepID=A0A4Y7UA41_9FLAO|nr:non-ribosomal peptide synthetase [Flavobacterium circumlabens]TCN55434.1 amino acid adenylation domain-containing protein [Flavobacterium circumlabens]TEB43154.1 amino acid adenylation domain-containing protein [Flavobacterium circumlabens]